MDDGRLFSMANLPGTGINSTMLDRLDFFASELSSNGVFLR